MIQEMWHWFVFGFSAGLGFAIASLIVGRLFR
jgi:RsiW-degrading membrane proteinase PrsW (M82 family)